VREFPRGNERGSAGLVTTSDLAGGATGEPAAPPPETMSIESRPRALLGLGRNAMPVYRVVILLNLALAVGAVAGGTLDRRRKIAFSSSRV
jgi:hypothetical protein